MNRGGALAAALAGCCFARLAAAAPPPEPARAQLDETVASPYLIDHSPRDLAQRAERHRTLAAAAAARGDLPRQARHAAMACLWHSLLTFDPGATAPSCAEASRLAASAGLPDVPLVLDAAPAELALWSDDFDQAERVIGSILARGAGLDPAAAEAHPVRLARLLQGIALTETGRFGAAAAAFEVVRAESRRAGDHELFANGELWDCWNDVMQGELIHARGACDRTRALVAETGDFLTALNLAYIEGVLRTGEGDLEGALASFRQTLELAARPGGVLRGPTARYSIANVLVRLRRLGEARAVLEAIDRDRIAGRFPRGLTPLVEHGWGMLERASQRPAEAARHFAISARSSEHFMSIWGLRGLAGARRQLGDQAGARAALEEAIRRVESERTSLGGAAPRATFGEVHAAIYRDLVGVRWDGEGAGAASAALEIAEAGKARALLDTLADAHVIGVAAPTLTAAAVQAGLGPDEVLVEYVSAEDRLFAITVTRDRIAFTPLPGAGTAEALEQRVAFFASLVQESDEPALGPAARRLHEDLLAPALAGVGPGARTLIIAADGPLHRLPFDALGEATRVIDRWDVALVPSASVLAARPPRAAPRAAALVVSAPADLSGLATLPAAPAEAAAIRRRVAGEIAELTGAGATLTRLRASGLDRFAVLHFASHALVDESRPLRSSLLLAPEPGRADGHWHAADIYRAKLATDLVVLSACSTAGGAIAEGEGVMSLARAFLHAGAGATVATLWDVPDAPSPVFADVLYGELAAGRSLGVAVAAARRELRRRGAPPRAWAAWVLSGAPGGRVGVTARSAWAGDERRLPIGLAAAGLLAGAALVVLGSRRRGRGQLRRGR